MDMVPKLFIRTILVILLMSCFNMVFPEKPVIDVSVNVIGNESIEKITKSVFLSELLDTNKFTVTLRDNIMQLFSEMSLQDLLSTQNVILSKKEYPKGSLNVLIYLNNLSVRKESVEYVRNNISGEYIYANGKYIRVIQGARFKFDGKNYIQDDNGMYVRGNDGKYYIALDFYSKVPHENTYYVLECNISYVLSLEGSDVKKDAFAVSVDVPLVLHKYDPYNNRLLRTEYPASEILNQFAKNVSFELANRLLGLRKLYGFVDSVKFPRALIDIGSIDGVKPGFYFGVYDGDNYIAELKVVRTAGDYSECEVTYIKSGAKIKEGFFVAEKKPDFVFPLGISILYLYHPESFGSIEFELSVKTLNIHREEISALAFGFGYDLSNSEIGSFRVSYFQRIPSLPVYALATLKIFDNTSGETISAIPMVGFNIKFGIFALRALTTIDFSTLELGGGVSW
ncbi:hypothetical protein [Fervidobacterium pennivorans]|uniref:hypothetical protein n=1 Tax=Fervidobacterium pennivorans TaxID=93466 RepID=UPI0014366FB7|nr:hypothetical protein [Fervidobacterium pennivorans]QIV77746.1 hypothetical protein HER11_01220 [Fervidobacterium pennivorans subsp. keratinolyticus]